jgi:hypothetical protein
LRGDDHRVAFGSVAGSDLAVAKAAAMCSVLWRSWRRAKGFTVITPGIQHVAAAA